jgi:hypothetical protein
MVYLLLRSPLTRGRKISQHRIRGEKDLDARHTGSDLGTQQEIQNVCKIMQKFSPNASRLMVIRSGAHRGIE